MRPILKEIKEKYATVEYAYVYSDGPTTQYRQKANFYLLSTEIYELGYKAANWNFHEAGHGKGIPDGIGGVLKREADRCVRHGADIMNAMAFVKTLQETNISINLYIVQQDEINEIDRKIKLQELKSVPGTMKLHQVITSEYGKIRYRDVSCNCLEKTCIGHTLQDFSFVGNSKSRDRKTNGHLLSRRKRVKSLQSDRGSEKINTCKYNEDVEENFRTCLDKLHKNCTKFAELQFACQNISLNDITGEPRYILKESLSVDHTVIDICPVDIPDDRSRFPVTVRADGDCLPGSGSVFAFGNDAHPNEIRTRIAIELALHKDYYLDDNNLKKGLKCPPKNGDTTKAFAMYSEEYVAGVHLTPSIIEMIFEHEVLKLVKPKSYMGIWQLFGLSSVLQMPIYSVYPNLGNPMVRADLHTHNSTNPKTK